MYNYRLFDILGLIKGKYSMKKLLVLLAILAIIVPSVASASFDKNVKYGTRNSDIVREIQEFLTDQSVYSGPVTGNLFALTRTSIKRFQQANGVRVTSTWDTATRNKANELLAVDEQDEPGVETAPTNLQLIRFPDGSVYDSNGRMISPAPPVSAVTPSPVDVCPNIEGVQSVIPVGMVNVNGNCVINPPTATSTIDTEKANRVKNEISSYISELNGQIKTINDTFIPHVGYIYLNGRFNVVQLEDAPDSIPLPLSMATNVGFPANFYDYQRTIVNDLRTKILKINESITRLNTITSEINDYSSTGTIPSAEERTYLQTLGINW